MEPMDITFEGEQVIIAHYLGVDQNVLVVTEYQGETPHNGFIVPLDETEPDYVLRVTQSISRQYAEFAKLYSSPLRGNIRYTKPLLNFKDYRKTDVSHINRLTSLTRQLLQEQQFNDPGVGTIRMVTGHAVLPGGYILTTDLSKSIDPSKFDVTLATQIVSENLVGKVDDRLWDLESYRLYRNLMTLDNIIANEALPDEADLALLRIANGAIPISDHAGEFVYLSQFGLHYQPVFIGSQGRLWPGVSKISYEGYHRAMSIIDSYIELQ
jgi:hypothetical protein